jgi:Chaperone of endosialidase
MASLSANKQYAVPTVNADNNVWGSELNSTLAAIDLNLGGSQIVSLAAGNVVASAVQAATLITVLNGTLTGNTEYILPSGYGALLIFSNQTNGGGTVTIASAGGGTSVIIPQNAGAIVYTDGTNVEPAAGGPLVGPITIATGPVTIASGNLTLSAGNLVLTLGNLVLTDGALVVNTGGVVSTTSTAQGVTSTVTGTAALGAFNGNVNDPATQALANWFNGATAVGAITTDGTHTIYGGTSDARLKEDAGTVDDTLSGRMIDRLKPRWFRWRSDADGKPEGKPEPGFFAQELNRVFPWAVRVGRGRPGTKGFQPWMTDVAKLMPVVIAELQFLRRRVAELERQNASQGLAIAKMRGRG